MTAAGKPPSAAEETSPLAPAGSVHASGRRWLLLSDGELLSGCEVDTYRASGPGGQKRNKTSSAVRLRHTPTGLMVIAVESRSQHENRARAVRRLREAIALTQRNSPSSAEPPDFYAAALHRDKSLHVSPKHPDYWLIVQHILDVFEAKRGSVSEAGDALGISTGQLVRFLKEDDKLWQQASRMRKAFGLGQLH